MKKYLLTLLIGVTASAGAVTFSSPTGNIICVGDTDEIVGVECYIDNIQKSTVKKPAGCQLDWGQTFFVGRTGKAQVVCHGDVPESATAPYYKPLGYGQTQYGKGWTCTSKKTGMTCKNQVGRGFTLSRNSQKTF